MENNKLDQILGFFMEQDNLESWRQNCLKYAMEITELQGENRKLKNDVCALEQKIENLRDYTYKVYEELNLYRAESEKYKNAYKALKLYLLNFPCEVNDETS